MDMGDYEKLGVFYLGRQYDAMAKKADGALLYDSKDLVTHAVCVGMTGSGKTGLCIGLIEEAAIDGIPAIVIDPKGDLTNLLLTFPELRPEDFRPFVNEEDARTKGVAPEEYAAQQADLWRKGLADWDQQPDRVARLKSAAEFAVYTPASSAGRPVSILRSFGAPDAALIDNREAMRERVTGTASSLLSLAGIDSENTQSREHILMSTILDKAWRTGQDLDLAGIIQQIQSPPVTKIGVMDLDSFFPAKDRFQLAMALNNLLASPGFEAWLEGEALDLRKMLYTASGKPRVAIFSIAHLSDSERMFFVSLLLNQTLSWMRTQSGTTSLRALLYMDEIFGYFPPVANPPSKQPLLTLLKQARAFGLGVVLATQNPVDLDYKGLSNAGTWFIGRLQTQRDKDRLLDGLAGAAGEAGGKFDRQAMDDLISSLGSRVFVLNNVHDDAPEVFQTRWTLSYLRGPLTRDQIRLLTGAPAQETATEMSARTARPDEAPVKSSAKAAASAAAGGARPVLPPDIAEHYLPLRAAQSRGAELFCGPMIYGAAQVRFTDKASKVDEMREFSFITPIGTGAIAVDWASAEEVEVGPADLEKGPADGALYAELPPAAAKAKNYTAWEKDFATWLYQTQKLSVMRSPTTEVTSNASESERDFRTRLQQTAREQRDAVAEKLRQKYAPKLATLQERLRRAQQMEERQRAEAAQQKIGTMVSIGTTLLGAFLGRKAMSATTISKASTAVRTAGRMMKENQDIAQAGETVEVLQQALNDLNSQFQAELEAVQAKLSPENEELESIEIAPKKSNINVKLVGLVWAPYWKSGSGDPESAW
ncbi:MAG: ATP-binding protein [Bryobacteraceae bacterium]